MKNNGNVGKAGASFTFMGMNIQRCLGYTIASLMLLACLHLVHTPGRTTEPDYYAHF